MLHYDIATREKPTNQLEYRIKRSTLQLQQTIIGITLHPLLNLINLKMYMKMERGSGTTRK